MAANSEPADLLVMEGIVVDPDTGEITEWPDGVSAGPERLEYIIRQQLSAAQAAKHYGIIAGALKAQAGAIAYELGSKTIATGVGKVTNIAGHENRRAPIDKVAQAVTLELITDDEATDLILNCATELDPRLVGAWVDANTLIAAAVEASPLEMIDASPDEYDEKRRGTLRAILIQTSQTASYTTVSAAVPKPPRLETRKRTPDAAE